MKATDFEYRHQTFLHLLVIGLAVLTYVAYPDDIVWALVRHHPNSRLWERVVFGAGASVMFASAYLDAYAEASRGVSPPTPKLYFSWPFPARLARLLLALVLGLWLPPAGTLILITLETILLLRLLKKDLEPPPISSPSPTSLAKRAWRRGFQTSVSKWGLAATMLLFTLTLRDRIAEIGAICSLVIWLALNANRLKATS